jgi:tubulin polyglutamylase TTLL5
MMRKLAQRASAAFYPESYLLPDERAALDAAFPMSSLWISKPGGGARGEGISVIDRLPGRGAGNRVIQRYIANPMLIRGLKFDLRFYVAVLSVDPLRIYVHENGLVRLATESYAANVEHLGNRSAHLTNFSINKSNPAFVSTDDMQKDGTGNKWTHTPFWKFLKDAHYEVARIRSEIDDAFVAVIMAAREAFLEQAAHRLSFEVFGFDVMLDDEGKVFVLEVNVTPAMGTSSNLDLWVKGPVVRDLYNAALVPIPGAAQDRVEAIVRGERNPEVTEFVAVCEYELAATRLGGFRCIWPTVERAESHGKMLLRHTRADMALERWVAMQESEKAQWLTNCLPTFMTALSHS